MKKYIYILIVLAVLVGGFYAFNAYIYNQKQGNGELMPPTDLSGYFQEQVVILGVGDIGMPIEGFDDQLLIIAFPGLIQADFENVETFEGHYELVNEESVFVRDVEQPITSAERTIANEGYKTLFENVSTRLSHSVESEADVDSLIERINTGERINAKINQGASFMGIKIIPQEILEDSRCPVDVQCVWAGTVRVRSTFENSTGASEQIFELQKPITIEETEITLVQVEPVTEQGKKIESQDYVFTFEIINRFAVPLGREEKK